MFAITAAIVLASSPAAFEQRESSERSAPAARARPTPRSAVRPGFGLGVTVGPAFSLGDGPVWIKAGARFSYELSAFNPNFQIAVILPVIISGARSEDSISTIQSTGFEILPGARFLLEVMPRLRVYADAGLGAVVYNFNVRINGSGGGNNLQGSTAGFGFRFGLGAEYALMDMLSIQVEPISLLLQAADSVVYRLGGVTLRGNPMPPHFGINLGITYRF